MSQSLKFIHPWRAYQARVLKNLDRYRADRRIHIVAPPGAGKTVLGLEIVRRINLTTLILVPSLTIRAQWAERYRDDFGAHPDIISNDIDEPGQITIVTYQAVFEYHKRNELAGLEWVQLLVVDECHHLRNEWWRVLTALREKFAPELVALTATPPYDVSGREWRRYNEFCGEIDEEISVPELVASGDLCPHQDYLYPVLPPAAETNVVAHWTAQKLELLTLFTERSGLAYFLQTHPWLAAPEENYADIFETPEYFTALLSVLKAQGSEPPASALGILHGEATLAPNLNDRWAAVFLQKALRSDPYFDTKEGKAYLRPYRRIITAMGAWHKGKLQLDSDLPPGKQAESYVIDSAKAKLEALVEIARVESEDMGAKLRMVFLTDFIYPEFLPTTEYDRTELTKVGTVPVFEALRRQTLTLYEGDLCLLTGSLVIIPETAKSRLLELAYEDLPTGRLVTAEALFPNSKYLKLNTGGLAHRFSVRWITQLFEEGLIRIIVGTKSLLGEGWDAPVINSLVLANQVGSFVLSNQMRGRAIRTVRGVPDKTANIWHPVVIHPGMHKGGPDLKKLARRMKAFAGPRHDGKPVIQNGLDRFGIDFNDPSLADVQESRLQQIKLAGSREDLIEKWKNALATGEQLIEAIKPPSGNYYARKDPLTVHYRESVDRYFEADYRKALLQIKVATLVAALAAATSLFVPVFAGFSWVGLSAAVLSLLAAGYLFLPQVRKAQELRLAQRQPGSTGKELKLLPYAINPVVISLAVLPFGLTAFAAYWSACGLWLLGHMALNPMTKMKDAARRFEILSNTRTRLQTYGAALARVLESGGMFHSATASQLRLEEDGEELFLYLDDAEHHDAHLFATSLAELMSPVENPRYLLQLQLPDDWTKGEYFLSVPSVLGNKKSAAALSNELSKSVGEQLDPVYTREPSGRLHLLTARLQATERQELTAERDMLWR